MIIRQISDEEAKILVGNGAGYFGERVSIGDANSIVIEGRGGKFLAPRTSFVFSEFSVAPRSSLVKRIGGLLWE